MTDDVGILNAKLELAVNSQMRRFKQLLYCLIGCMVGLVGFVLLMPLLIHWGIRFPQWTATLYSIFSYVIISIVGQKCFVASKCFIKESVLREIDALAENKDLRTIGCIASILCSFLSDKRRHYYIQALTEIIPRLQPSDACMLTAQYQQSLFLLMSPRYSIDHSNFQLVFLKALEQFGDTKSLPIINRLASMKPTTQNECRVQKAAQESIALLQQKFCMIQSDNHLLRAADAAFHDPKTLLRSTEKLQKIGTDNLLLPTLQDQDKVE